MARKKSTLKTWLWIVAGVSLAAFAIRTIFVGPKITVTGSVGDVEWRVREERGADRVAFFGEIRRPGEGSFVVVASAFDRDDVIQETIAIAGAQAEGS